VSPEVFARDEAGDGSDDLTGTGAVAGTVPYLSPEAISGAAPDPSFDLWGLCVALYEAIAGVNPMRPGPRDPGEPRAVLGEAPDIREYVPGCPAEVAEFFLEALNPDPKRRPPTGRALARRLRGLLELPVSVASPT
jgi:eukaryotic-like serine/threonine-protein kinase